MVGSLGSLHVSCLRLTASVRHQLRALAAEVSAAESVRAATSLVERGMTTLLGVPVQLAPRLEPSAASALVGAVALPAGASGAPAAARTLAAVPDDSAWPLGLLGDTDWILRVEGRLEGVRARLWFTGFTQSLAGALQSPALREQAARHEAIVATTYTFARRLTKLHDDQSLAQFILDTMAANARARLGAIALYQPATARLQITATYGYPHVLVEHVRTAAGEGVLGHVLETRRPLLVQSLADMPLLHTRRPRYRTASFLAVPLLANGEVLGVVALADRHDGLAFDRGDLTTARALAAPAALALLNDQLTRLTRELAHAATVDPLTGLFNRRYFHTRIEEEVERARRYTLDLALLLADVDNFKLINDQLGHLAGDHLLRQVAEVLRRSVRVFDVCTRFGGEEFAILMPGSNAANALVVAERIRSRVESATRSDGHLPPNLQVTISLGLSVLEGEVTSQDLIGRADRALYRAKAEGKNRVHLER
jgi:diguanylate cyclase (GGDEF)-like protein